MIAYHATTKESYNKITKDGFVKSMRMPNVYLFTSIKDAQQYMKEFNLEVVCIVEITTNQIESKWNPSYAKEGVIKLKAGENARLIAQV